MKKAFLIILFFASLVACKSKKGIPDVSDIKVEIKIERFEKEFFEIDSNNVNQGLNQLSQKFPLLSSIFLQNILGLDSTIVVPGVKRFLHLNKSINDTVAIVFKNIDGLKKDFQKAFQFVKYYFPAYKVPVITTVVGPIDALAQTSGGYTPDFLGPDFLGISLQFYLGKNYSVYKDGFFIENIAPEYRSRRFSKEYIIADAMQLVVDDIAPDQSGGKSLIDQMIEKGKQWFLLDKFLPATPDSIKTGFTQSQLDWCSANEGLIWSYLVKNEDLHSLNPTVIQTYIGEGPFTQGLSQEESPGNIGQWIGWQIVKKFASKNSGMAPMEIMKTPATTILEQAKYKPR